MDPKVRCYAITGAVVLVVLIGLLVWSADTVEPIEYGIKYNTLSKNINSEEVYDGGWYIIWPMNSFITYPATVVSVDFADYANAKSRPFLARSQEGLSIEISFSWQYQLIKEQIPALYKLYQQRYEENYIRLVKGAIIELSSNFNTTDYWKNRDTVGEMYRKAIDDKLILNYARCTGFQLLTIVLPQIREQSLINTQISQQTAIQSTYEKNASDIRAGMSVQNSSTALKISVIEAEARATATKITNDIEASIRNLSISTQALAYQEVTQLTGLSPATDLNQYIYFTGLKSNQNSTLLVGVDRAILSIQK